MSIEESVYEGLARRVETLQSANVTLQGKIEALEKASQWIPVSERLPQQSEVVIVFFDGVCIETDLFEDERFQCFGKRVSHWMPTQKPPAIAQGDDLSGRGSSQQK